jgi:endoglucanase
MRFHRQAKIKIGKNIKRQIMKGVTTACLLALTVPVLSSGFIGADASEQNGLHATYFNNMDLTDPAFTRIDDTVDFDWGYNSPSHLVHPETFSARWEGKVLPRYSGNYNFHTFSDDGVRLWVNGSLIINNWTDHSRTEDTGTINLTAGQKYDLKLEYYENTQRSIIRLFWSSDRQSKEIVPKSNLIAGKVQTAAGSSDQTQTGQGLLGKYYSGINFERMDLERIDSNVNFNWGSGRPAENLPADIFSVRWTGQVQPPQTADYTFYTVSDDGVRLWVNDLLLINNWTDHAWTEDEANIRLEGGKRYNIQMEFYERYGLAEARLLWSASSMPKQAIHQSALFPSDLSAQQHSAPQQPEPAPQNFEPQQTTTPTVISSSNPFANVRLFVNPDSDAKRWADANRSRDPNNAALMDKIARQPESMWIGGWNSNIYNDVKNYTDRVTAAGAMPVFIAYNIPQRDCGGYSAGGVGSPDAYRSWTRSIASAIGNRKAAIILEPDALALTDCLSSADRQTRYQLIKDAIGIYKAQGNTYVYVDAGHSGWVPANEIAQRLKASGVDSADGFALNTSNFVRTQDNINYGSQISSGLNGKRFVIDTSRNGQGPAAGGEWCNPQGRGLGQAPTANTGNSLVDAFLWVKKPGESDGNCNGGPSAGVWWTEYALGLAQRSIW